MKPHSMSISENAGRLRIVSQERIISEINKIMMCDKPSKGFILLERSGLLS